MKIRQWSFFIGLLTLSASSTWLCGARAIVGPAHEGASYRDRIIMILSRGPEGSGFCTGVVLAPRVVLTAAHCVRATKNLLALYRDDSNRPITINVTRAVRHPAYRDDAIRRRLRSVDLGLVELETPLPDTFRASPLANRVAEVGESVEVAGFGVGLEGDPKTGGVARSAALRVAEPASKIILWARDSEARGLGACSGDSGAPIFAGDRQTLLAIVAWTKGEKGRDCGLITQGLLVAPERDWILGAIGDWAR